jgi:predicted RNA-binding Zn ribbon-like protein
VASGILSADEAQVLSASATERELTRLRALRTSLERVFRAEVAGRRPVAADLAAVSRAASAAASAARLQHRQGRLVRRIDLAQTGAATLRWRLADAAVELLTSPHMERVKACSSCGWFFRDESKNGSRRWCSMATCGSIEKSRAYYARTRRTAR